MIDVVSRYVQLLSHELNNPLTVLLGQSALLGAQAEALANDPEKIRAAARTLEHNVQRVIGLVAELRESLRDLENEPAVLIPVGKVLTGAATVVGRAFRAKDVALNISPVPEDLLICVGPSRVRTVLWKLLARALERGATEVNINWVLGERELVISVHSRPLPAEAADLAAADLRTYGETLAAYRGGLLSVAGGVEIYLPRVD